MSNFGEKVGDAVKGVLQTGHGAGEAIRGNFNQAVDSAGEGLEHGSSHNAKASADAKGHSSDYNQPGSHQGIADNGAQEFKQGIDKLANTFSSHNSSSTTTTTSNHNV